MQNAGPCTSGSVCGETDDAGEVEAEAEVEWEASRVSEGDERYVLIVGLGIIGASLGKGMQEAKAGIEEPLELILAVRWWANGAGAG